MEKHDIVLACCYGDLETMRNYLVNGGNPNMINEKVGWPLIFHAIDNFQMEVIRLLLENGANVNIRDVFGQTPLFLAVDTSLDSIIQGGGELGTERIDCIQLLLENGADINIKNKDGIGPFEVARTYNSHKVIALLRNWSVM